MIPRRLELTNFLSYRETAVLEFDGIHTACISGANGAGKSSILDSITWALFGNARSRSDDDLVNRLAAINGDSAEVRFIFELEGSLYRVIRRKAAGKRLLLELQVATNPDQPLDALSWKPLSESKVRETQEAIEKLLRMNYDTFSNASFLLQGKADEFTTKTPNQRKEVLADLLGVSIWEQYKEAATERRKGAELDLRLLDGRLEEIERELAEEEERKTAVADIQAESERVGAQLALQEQLLNQARQTEAAIAQQERTVQQGANTLAQARRTLATWQQQQQQRQQERDGYTAILAAATAIETEFAAWQTADQELQGWQDKADQAYKLQQQKRPFELTITQTRSRLEQQQRQGQAQAAQVAAAASERAQVAAQIAAGQQQLTQLEAELAELAAQEQAYQEARLVLQQLESERRLWGQEQQQLARQKQQVGRWQEEETAVSQNLAAANQRLTELAAQLGAIASQSQRHAAALAERDTLQAEQPRLREQMNKLKERLDRLGEEAGSSCPLCGQPLTESHRQEVLTELQQDGEELANRFRDNKKRLADLQSEINQLQAALQETPRLEREQQTQQQRLAQAEARLAEISQAVADWEVAGAVRLAELEKLLGDETAVSAQKQQVATLETAVGRKTSREKARQSTQRTLSTHEARLGEIDRLTVAWESEGAAALAEVVRQLTSGDFAAEAQVALAELETQTAAVGYDPAAHEGVRQRVKGLQTAVTRHQELRQAEAAVKPLEDALADLGQRLTEQTALVETLAGQQETAVAHLETLRASSSDRRAIEDEVFRLREVQISINRRVGAAQQLVGVLEDLRQQQGQLQDERAALTQRVQRLGLLEKACGRGGVQALLIEQALPDIEDRANELLERLTGSEMRIMFETQKQLKSRDAVAETLDIRISDSAGERPYDNFSGGEQFRVNFAIRLALSQLLAKRAGARLQTLVIDEGFGSQDPNGRQRLIEAINTIQDDFARILVITHIDELRDAFPTRIEVEKGLNGSQIRVS